jgi:hypothetical protein
MELTESGKIMGLHEGISYGQFERTDELNQRMQSRHFPDVGLAPNYDPRPVPTKYSHFPIVDRRAKPSVPMRPYLDHVVELNFNPGTSRGPSAGYFANVDKETVLRNQAFALQHGADQGVYVPSSQSDLYKVTVVSRPGEAQPFPQLFEAPQFASVQHPNIVPSIGGDVFANHTRTQLRS